MKRSRVLVAMFALLFLPAMVKAQAFQFVVPDYYLNRLKTIDQFMERFNREDSPTYLDSADKNYPYVQLLSCFCSDSVRYRKGEVEEFIQTMVDNNIHLGYSIPNYFCELKCKAMFKKKKTEVIIRMVVEQMSDGSFKWSIAGAEGEILKTSPNMIAPSMRISPVDNDQDFLDLRRALKDDAENILCYSRQSWKIDQTSVFMSLVAHKLLTIETIEDMSFVFSVAGYWFVVRRIDRETNNNGWLICNFERQ